MSDFTFSQLFAIIKQKIDAKDSSSYSFRLTQDGLEKITRKIGEEAVEVVIAAFLNEKKNDEKTREELIGEVCDLLYHSLVLLAHKNISLDEILAELNKRNNKKDERNS